MHSCVIGIVLVSGLCAAALAQPCTPFSATPILAGSQITGLTPATDQPVAGSGLHAAGTHGLIASVPTSRDVSRGQWVWQLDAGTRAVTSATNATNARFWTGEHAIAPMGTVIAGSMQFPGLAALNAGATGFINHLSVWKPFDRPDNPIYDNGSDIASAGQVPDGEESLLYTLAQPGLGSSNEPWFVAGIRHSHSTISTRDILARGPGKDPTVVARNAMVLGDGQVLADRDPIASLRVSDFGTSAAMIGRVARRDGEVACVLHSISTSETPLVVATAHAPTIFNVEGNWQPGTWERFTAVGALGGMDTCTPETVLVAGEAIIAGVRTGVVVRGNSVLLRSGQTICGYTLMAYPLAAAVNRVGDYAVVWPAATEFPKPPHPVLIINGQVALAHRDTVPQGQATPPIDHIYPDLALGAPDASWQASCYVKADSSSPRVFRVPFTSRRTADCVADFNGDGASDQADLVAFIDAWSQGNADISCDGVTDRTDLDKFIDLWMSGC